MIDAAVVVSNFIFKWSQEKYILLRFRILIASLMVVYLLVVYFTYVAPMLRGVPVVTLRLTQAWCDAILMYVLGAMQAAPVNYELFPVWAAALVSFRSCVRGLSEAYDTQVELGNVVKLLFVAYMNLTQGSKIGRIPFWIFWSLLVLKCLYRIVTCCRAPKTLWNGRNSELLQAYMGPDQPQSNFVDNTSSPNGAMEGCKYLVFGESEPGQCSCGSSTTRDINIKDLKSVVTLQKCVQALKEDLVVKPGCTYNWKLPTLKKRVYLAKKRVYLPFALSRLLRCRLEGAMLHAGTVSMNRKLLIHSTDNKLDLFDILESDVLYVKHCLLTNFPMICSYGLPSLGSGFILAALKFSVALWLSGDFFSAARHQLSRNRSSLAHQHNLSAIDLNITGVAILFTALSDGHEISKCFLSRWTKLLVWCSWAKNLSSSWRAELLRCIIFLLPVVQTEFETMDQYAFLGSFSYIASKCWRLPSLITGEMTADSKTLACPISIYEHVKTEVLSEALQGLDDLDGAHPLPRNCFAPVQHDANTPAPAEQYWSEVIQTAGASGCSHVILVWHIATSLCEMKLAQEHGVNLSISDTRLPCFTTLAYRRFKSLKLWLVHEKMLDDDLWKKYSVANSLSRYCAYLLVSKPYLLPGNIWVSNKAFQQAVQCALQMLHGCPSLQSMYDKLISSSQEEEMVASGTDEGRKILQQGARLAKKLIDGQVKEQRWETLAKVWARLLVHLSPSSNAQAHAKSFESKYFPEFITIVWALFSHCGIEKSELWDAESSALVPGTSEQYTHLDNIRLWSTCCPPSELENVEITGPSDQQDAHVDNICLWSTSRHPPAEVQETTEPSDPHVDNIRLWSTSHQPAGDLEDGGEIQEINRGG